MSDLIQAQTDLQPVKSLIEQAHEVKVVSAKDIEEAGYTLKKLSDSKKMVEDYRISMTKPLNESLRAINNFFKQFSEPLELVDRQIRNDIKAYNEQFKEKETIDQRDYAELSLAAKNKVGGVKLKKVWTFEIIDEKKIPASLMMVNEMKIKNRIREGVREIAGLRIYQEEIVSL